LGLKPWKPSSDVHQGKRVNCRNTIIYGYDDERNLGWSSNHR